jgi:hypothetical protein
MAHILHRAAAAAMAVVVARIIAFHVALDAKKNFCFT